MKKRTKRIILWIAVVVATIAGFYALNIYANRPGPLDDFALCLKDKGAVFYGAFWCQHCQSQKAEFGNSARLLPYIECSTPDGRGQLKVCSEKGIDGYPTWTFADGSREFGEVALSKLAEDRLQFARTMIPVASVNFLASLFTLGAIVFVLFTFAGYLLKRAGAEPVYMRHIRIYAFEIAFFIALISVLGSLYYSEIVRFEPCVLCWWQRVFMVPLAILLGISVWRRDGYIADYAIVFASLGALIAGYHYALEWSGGSLPCPSGGAVSCAKRYVFEFGFISVPLMAFSAFSAIISALWVRERSVADEAKNK